MKKRIGCYTNIRTMTFVSGLLVFLATTFPTANTTGLRCSAQDHPHTMETNGGMVVSESSLASRAGRDALANGGNAVDAAVATAFALAVTWPEAGNIGGGGFMIVRPADGEAPVCIDYRESAPLAATENTYTEKSSTLNRRAVGVPATVRGLELAHKRYGKLPWKDLVLPAVNLAADGFTVNQALAGSVNGVLSKTNGKELYAELHRVYGCPTADKWTAGDVMKLPDLAKTLTSIANDGADAFYQGPLADLLVDEMKKGTGIITQADLDVYEAKVRPAIVGTFNGYEVIGAPPPSSGGTCIVQMLNIVEALQPPKDRYTPETIHLLAEASRRAFLDRARHLGDPDFVKIPEHLTSKKYARELAIKIDRSKATDSETLAPDIQIADESPNTTHFSVADSNGMAVSNTYTLEASWGSRMVVPGAGYVLNNEMGDFNWLKGVTNRKGRIGTDANLIRPKKRMLSSQCPVIVAKDNKVVLVTGSPGGRTIINTVFNIVVNHTYFGMSATESVRAPRFHHQWLPDRLQLEYANNPPVADAVETLEKMGHKIFKRVSQGSAHTIFVDSENGTFVGIADPRRSGRPAGIGTNRLACWNFGEVLGTTMEKAISNGSLETSWSQNIDGAVVDGEEHLTIRRDAPNNPSESFALVGEEPPTRLSAFIKFDGVSFGGKTRDEQIRLGLTNASDKPEVTARIILSRTKNNTICVSGEALGPDATLIQPTEISPTNKLSDPTTLRFDIDSQADTYSIWIRQGSEMKFKNLGTGKIANNRVGKYLRLSTVGDMSANDEYAKIDRIELRESK